MKLDNFYKLRKDFVVIGLTGRVGSGCSEVSKLLNNQNFILESNYIKPDELIKAEDIKFDISYNYLATSSNFEEFQVINYKNILLLHLFFEAKKEDNPVEYIISTITQYGDNYDDYINRFGVTSENEFIDRFRIFLNTESTQILHKINSEPSNLDLWLKNESPNDFSTFFFNEFKTFADLFYGELNKENITKRTRFTHDIALNLREIGKCSQFPKPKTCNNLESIYTVAETINRVIKLWRKSNENKAKIVIDALKNSLELMYFKEKYSGFYIIAINKKEKERKNYVEFAINEKYIGDNSQHIKEVINLDDNEYKGDDVNDGEFGAPDIENCIQKSDFHIFHSKDYDINHPTDRVCNLKYQLIKLLSLISHPGIITPTPIERTMQIAYNAKYNSGCISRQVGAVITDVHYSVKSIGWNDVAQNQMPCKLRNVEDLISGTPQPLYSKYELEGGEFKSDTDVKQKFIEAIKEDVEKVDLTKLNGLNCSFCFKSHQNAYENIKNQVHTRSLHAEENAMMQIAKNGGEGLKGGYLFTTASPCELCSKKAFQLGVEKIFYIDPYPGIAKEHTLLNGVKGNGQPDLEMFRGAVGRTFHKLYEPFLSYKDEIKILSDFKPTTKELSITDILKNKKIEDEKIERIKSILDE